jgi:Pectate lyase superfamily protein
MALNLVPLILDLYDGGGNLITSGTASLVPTSPLIDAADNVYVAQSPVVVNFHVGASPLVQIIPTDNANVTPDGWAWQISFDNVPGDPPSYIFGIAGDGTQFSFTATSAAPAVFTASGSALANGTPVVLSGPASSLPGNFWPNTVYYVVDTSGDTFSLATTASGAAVASTSSGSGEVAVAQYLSSVSVVTGVPVVLPLPVADGGTGSTTQNWQGLLTPVSVTQSSGSYPAAAGVLVKANIYGGSWTVELPQAPPANTIVGAKIMVNSTTNTNTLTIACQGSDVFEQSGGSTTATMTLPLQSAAWQYNAGYWTRLDDDLPLGQLDDRYTKWFNVKAYGALGNNTDATAAITAAISAAQAAGGGTVYFPAGVYLVHSALWVGGGNPGALVLRGDGWDSQLQLTNGANCYIFNTGNQSNNTPLYTPGLRVCDLYLNCNGSNQTADSGGIYAQGSCYGVFDHVWFDQPYNYGLRFYQSGIGGTYGHHNRIFGCYFSNGYKSPSGALGIGVMFDNADENGLFGCTFQDCGTATYPSCQAYDTGAGRQTFSDCTFVTNPSINVTAATMIKTNSSPSACKILGCDFDTATTGNLLEINGPDCVIMGNQFLSFGQGTGTTTNSAIHLSSSYNQVIGNGFTPQGNNGIAVSETGSANYNVIAGCALAGDTFYNGKPIVTVGAQTTYSAGIPGPADWFNVVGAFGADPTGTNNSSAAIQLAVTAASASGGTVYFPPGTYSVSSPVTVTGAGVILRGAGAKVSVLKMTASFGTTGVDRGIIEYLSGPSVFSGCGILDMGFDTSACTDTTTNAPNAVYQNGSVPMQYFTAERLYFNLNSYGQGILFNELGSGAGSYGLTFRDIVANNGAGTISCYNNGVTANSLVSGILIDNIFNHCTAANLVDDRVCISANNGGGTNSVEVRNISISNIYVEVVSGASGTVNGVKLDTGTYGYLHEAEIRNVYFHSLTTIESNNPVLFLIESFGCIQDVTVDGVHAYNSAALIVKMCRQDAAPYLLIRNVHMYNLQDLRAIEVYVASVAAGDESVVIENCFLHSGTAVSGSTPVGVMLTSGTSSQGVSGQVVISDVLLAGTFATGISDTLSESGSTITTGFANIHVSTCNLSAASVSSTVPVAWLTQIAEYAPTGLPGATASSGYAGATASGAPTTGTWAVGQWTVDQTGSFWICTTPGAAPSTAVFTQVVAGSNAATYAPTGLTGATASSAYAGATTSGAPTSGTWAVGDWTVDRTGGFWICTTAGTAGSGAAFTQVAGSGGALSNPMSTLGDTLYGGSEGVATRLGGNTTSTKEFLTSTGSAGSATAPSWGTIAATDLPAATTSAQGAVKLCTAPKVITPSNPADTVSTSLVMCGIGGTYEPGNSGIVLAIITGTYGGSSGTNAQIIPCYGTGTAPLNGASQTGTEFGAGAVPEFKGAGSTTSLYQFAFTDVLSLSAGTTYWFDLAQASTSGGSDTVNLYDIKMVLVELPS